MGNYWEYQVLNEKLGLLNVKMKIYQNHYNLQQLVM